MAHKVVYKGKAVQKILPALPANIQDLKPIEAPYFSAGNISVQGTSNDFMLLFGRPRPTMDMKAGTVGQAAFIETVAIIGMSPQTAKDTALALMDAVQRYERDYGKVNTTYSLQVEKSAKKKG